MSPYDDAHLGRRPVGARFDAAPITSDGGVVLLREVDRRIDLLGRMAGCFVDHRNPGRIQHSLSGADPLDQLIKHGPLLSRTRELLGLPRPT